MKKPIATVALLLAHLTAFAQVPSEWVRYSHQDGDKINMCPAQMSGTWTCAAASATCSGVGGAALTQLAAGTHVAMQTGSDWYSYEVVAVATDNSFTRLSFISPRDIDPLRAVAGSVLYRLENGVPASTPAYVCDGLGNVLPLKASQTTLNATGDVTLTKVNAAGGSANPFDYTGTLGAMNGGDDFTLFDINITNANHTGSNTIQVLDIAAITGDAQATETAIKVGSGWDYGIDSASAMSLSLDGNNAATTPLTITNTNEPTTGQTGDTAAIDLKFMSTSDGGSTFAAANAVKMTAAKESDYFNASGTDDNDAAFGLYVATNGSFQANPELSISRGVVSARPTSCGEYGVCFSAGTSGNATVVVRTDGFETYATTRNYYGSEYAYGDGAGNYDLFLKRYQGLDGQERFEIDRTTGVADGTAEAGILVGAGTATWPAVGLGTGGNTGFFEDSGVALAMTINGVATTYFVNGYTQVGPSGIVPRMSTAAGTAAAPSYAFNTEADTGMYGGANTVHFAAGGAEIARVTTTGFMITGGTATTTVAANTLNIGGSSIIFEGGTADTNELTVTYPTYVDTTAGDITVSLGVNSFGGLYYDGDDNNDGTIVDSTLTITNADTYYQFTGTTSGAASADVTCSATTDDCTISWAGTYEFVVQVSFKSDASGGTNQILCALFEEGTIQSQCKFARDVTSTAYGSASFACNVAGVKNDSYDVRCMNSTDGDEVDIAMLQMKMHKVGD